VNTSKKADQRVSIDIELCLIDFGSSFSFSPGSTIVRGGKLTGFGFHHPPEFKVGSSFDPSGINSYQFARLAIQILLLTPFAACKGIEASASKELKELEARGFDKALVSVLANGVSASVSARNKVFDEMKSLNFS
jgi:hypothetical protein